jgi:catechol 2,3-dioxygenase-like lactoylglutathione lyase family enzyme
MAAPGIRGFGHVDFSVSNMERSAQWWDQVMGFKVITKRQRDDYRCWNVANADGFVIGLVEHSECRGDRFDERAVGLDHFAMTVADRPTLEAWADHLDGLGIPHSGIQEENGGPLLGFRDPDNIQLELWAFDPNLIDPTADAPD